MEKDFIIKDNVEKICSGPTMKQFIKSLFDVRGKGITDEFLYIYDSIISASRKLLGLSSFRGFYLPRDIQVISKSLNNSIFYIQRKVNEISHIMPYYETKTRSVIKSILEKGDICIDVGAYIGTYSVLMARLVGSKGLVIAIEPSPISGIFVKNIRLNKLGNVILLRNAAYSKRKILNLYFTSNMPERSSIYKEWINVKNKKPVQVEAETLDSLLKKRLGNIPMKIKVLKIDAEGAEIDVLKGSKKVLNVTDFVIFESTRKNKEICKKILEKTGFKKITLLEHIDKIYYNFLAVRRDIDLNLVSKV